MCSFGFTTFVYVFARKIWSFISGYFSFAFEAIILAKKITVGLLKVKVRVNPDVCYGQDRCGQP